jgi:uncharacterized protein (DUF952 family)
MVSRPAGHVLLVTDHAEGPLLHLITPAEWRAALRTGAVTPPSLREVAFVHLSSPGQVHLPAERLFPDAGTSSCWPSTRRG